MEETNLNKNLENFIITISKKYNLEENVLMSELNREKKHFWETLFQLITNKSELINLENPSNKEINNDNNNNNPKEAFNREELEKEIEEYFKNNPEEDIEIWNKYKNESIKPENNNKIQLDNLGPTSASTVKKSNSNKYILKRPPSPNTRKKSVFISKNIKGFNFSTGVPNNRRHQSILFQIPKFNKNNSKKLMISSPKKDSNKAIKRSKFFKSPNKNRKSVILKIDNNSNFQYNNSKKNFLSSKNRRSVVIPKSNIKNKFSLNNSFNDKKLLDSPVKEPGKSKFNEKQGKDLDNKKKGNNEKDELIIFPDESDSDSLNKSDTISDNENIDKENKLIDKIDPINNKNIEQKEEKIIKTEKPIISIYKNKNTFVTIHKKQKPNPKPQKKMYLNISICHQINIFLKAVIDNISNKKNNNLKSKKEINNHQKNKKQKLDKIVKNSNKIIENKKKDDENNDINIQEKRKNKKVIKKSEIKNQASYNDEEDEDNINQSKKVFSCERKNKVNFSSVKKKNQFNRNLEIYDFTSESYNNILKKSKKGNSQDDEFYKPQLTTVTRRPEKKYYKMSCKNFNKYKNNNIYDSSRFLKREKIKKNESTKEKIKLKKIINNNSNNKNNKNSNNTPSLNDNFSDNNFNSKNKKKKKNYLERYKEAIENIMKNDNSIYNEESDIFYIDKNINKYENNQTEENNEIKYFGNLNSKSKIPKIKVKKNYFSSCQKIKKTKNNN